MGGARATTRGGKGWPGGKALAVTEQEWPGGERTFAIASVLGSSPQGCRICSHRESAELDASCQPVTAGAEIDEISMGILQGIHGKIRPLNLDIRIENAGDSHGFGRVGTPAGRKCSRHEFNPRTLHKFRRGMLRSAPAVHSCRLAAGGGEICAILGKLGEK